MRELNPPLPPFTLTGALAKVQAVEDEWNTCDPRLVSCAYTEDCVWRLSGVLLCGREQIVEFLTADRGERRDSCLRASLWAFAENRIAVRLECEWRDVAGQWWRSRGSELWECDDHGLMRTREATTIDARIDESDRHYFGARAEEHRGIDIP